MQAEIGNIKINHLNHLKGLIKQYSSETILKEYLQNADDAGSTELIITYDKQLYSNLVGTEFEELAGPSLLLSNNSKFKEKDFDSILEYYAEGKVEDSHSTGRFGLGFRSSYSITDYPSFISSDKIILLDDLRKSVCKNTAGTYASWSKDKFHSIRKWLKVFEVAGYDSTKPFDKTIFRLPLRSEKSALVSELSNNVFNFKDFLSWCDEWANNAKDLLFLRNINRLVLQEVDESGKQITHLEIKTKNKGEIESIRKDIKSNFSSKAIETCSEWISSEKKLPIHIYTHNFTISSFLIESKEQAYKEESWAVVNGLFRGEDNILLHAAEKALSIKSNVLPWAGAALQLDKDKIPIIQDGRWCTILPLFDSKHPVLLNGWLDLDNGRTKITYDGSGHELEILKKWNELLLEHAVGIAWALLIDSIKDKNNLKNYYKFWAKSVADTKVDGELESYLIKGFYKKISKMNCLYTIYQDEASWVLPSGKLHLFKDKDYPSLKEAFKEHFEIVIPTPNDFIVKFFEKIMDIKLITITPEYITNYLQTICEVENFPIPISDISISMLSKKNWLIDLWLFCSENGDNYSNIEGLPLELTLDKNINLIGNKEILLTSSADEDLLQNNLSIILDYDLYKKINIQKELPFTWQFESLTTNISLILSYWDMFQVNKQWIKYLIEYIVKSSAEDISQAKSLIWELPVVLQDDMQWARLKNDIDNYSPVLIPKKELANIHILHSLNMNLVNLDYSDIYQPLVALNDFITKLSAGILVHQLLSISDYSIFQNVNSQEYLVDLLASDVDWISNISEEEMDRFRNIPFVRTTSGELVSLNQTKLFIAAKFSPPEHIKGLKGVYQVVHPRNDEEYKLYKALGLDEQTIVNYIFKIIIPFIQNTPNMYEREHVLTWLVDEWPSIKAEFGFTIKNFTQSKSEKDHEFSKLKKQLQNISFIPTKSGEIKKASELYLPSLQLPTCLNDLHYIPIKISNLEEQWSSFLKDLRASNKVFASHVLEKVNSIVEKNDKEAYDDAIDLLKYIVRHIEVFEKLTIDNQPLLEVILFKEWYPVEDSYGFLIQPSKNVKRFATIKELAKYNDAKLICGSRYILSSQVKFDKKNTGLELSQNDILEKLGFETKLNIDDVMDSFNKLKKYSPTSEKEELELQKYAILFYRYLGRQHQIESFEDYFDGSDEIIYINNDWRALNRVFQESLALNGIFYWENLIKLTKEGQPQDELKRGLIRLGVKETPSTEVLVELLLEIYKGNNTQLSQSRAILGALQNKTMEELKPYKWDIPLLTDKSILLDSGEMYINDLPAYNKAEEKNDELNFCMSDFEVLAEKLDVAKLSLSVKDTLNRDSTVYSDFNSKEISDRLHNEGFKNGLLRLLYDEEKISRDELRAYDFENLLPSEIIFTGKLVIDWYADDDFAYTNTNATTHFEAEVLYLLNKGDFVDIAGYIAQYICKKTDLDSIIVMNMIRKNDSDEVQDYLDGENISALPLLPQSEIESIYGETPYESSNIILVEDDDSAEDIDELIDDNASVDTSKNEEERDKKDLAVPITSMKSSDVQENTHTISDVDSQDKASKNGTSNIGIDDSMNIEEKEDLPPPINPIESSDVKSNTKLDTQETTNNKSSVSGSKSQYRPNSSFDKSNSWEKNQKNTSVDHPSQQQGQKPDSYNSSNDYKPARVYNKSKLIDNDFSSKSALAKERGDKGEKFVLSSPDLLLNKENSFITTQANNPGFDIAELNKDGRVVRYIEIKSIGAKWGKGGVDVTTTQFDYAINEKYSDKWWLFVVEEIDSSSPCVYQLKNPVLDITRYQFDHSWKQFASNYDIEMKEQFEHSSPEIGDIYMVDNQRYEVLDVTPKGALFLVKVKIDNKEKVYSKKFNKSWKKIYD